MTGATSPVGVVVGMTSEAACLAGLGALVRIVCSGARPALALARAESLVTEGVSGLISFGLAGGLVEGVSPGQVLLPRAVVTPFGDVQPVDVDWHNRVVSQANSMGLAIHSEGLLAGSDRALAGVAAKAALACTTGALAVDMESHVVAQVAGRYGLPFLVLRAIADPAERGIPSAALVGLGPDGETRPGAVILRLLMAPWTFPALLRLAKDSRIGLTALANAIATLGPTALLSA